MQEAEAIFEHITNNNSFDLIAAHLAVNTTGPDAIQSQPESYEQLQPDAKKPKSASLEIIGEPLAVRDLVSLSL